MRFVDPNDLFLEAAVRVICPYCEEAVSLNIDLQPIIKPELLSSMHGTCNFEVGRLVSLSEVNQSLHRHSLSDHPDVMVEVSRWDRYGEAI